MSTPNPDTPHGARAPADQAQLLDQLSKLSGQALVTLVLLTAVFMVTAYLSNSLTIQSNMLGCGISLVVQLFTFQIIRVMRSSNDIKFPYGSGKLENFSGFLFGALKTPMSIYVIFAAVQRILHPPTDISFTIAQLPMLPSLARSFYFYHFAKRIQKSFDSPIAEQFEIDQKISIYFYCYVIAAMGLGLALKLGGFESIAVYIDPLFSFGVAIYSLKSGIGQLLKNFKVLIDLPMPEDEQLQIIRTLAREYDNYESIGHIHTRRSGTTRFIDIELFMKKETTVSEIHEMATRLQNELRGSLNGVKLNIIALAAGSERAR